MTSVKEPMCFVGPEWRARLAEYGDLFDRPAPVRGEASTAYAAYPWEPEIPDRIAGTVPDARAVYLVRDPVDRALSHYAQMVWDHMPVRPFDELMRDLEDPMNMPVWCSRYATQLERWQARVGPDRVLVVDQRDLRLDTAATVHRVLRFLGATDDFESPDWSRRHNRAEDHRRPTALARRLGPRAQRLRPLRPLLERPVPFPRPTRAQRARLTALLRPEAQRLREMTGAAFADWSV